MKYLYQRFYNNIRQNNLIIENDTVISAFSGGKDSVTLLLLLKRLQEDIRFTLKAAYFNHKLREDSNEEEKWVENYLEKKKIDLIKGSSDVISFKSRNKLNLENAASISRYDFFNKISDKFPNPKIATGHSKSDLTETFFIKLFRGSGLQGLSGIFGLKGQKIIRPILIFTKSEIHEFLNRSDEDFFSDPTNKSDTFLRNNIRNNLIPEIEKIEPDIDKHIFRTVSIIQEEFEYFRNKAQKFLSENLVCNKILPAQKLENEPLALRRHIIREFIRNIKGNLLNINFDHIEQLANDKNRKTGISIPGINFSIKKGFIYQEQIQLPEYKYSIQSTGETELSEICSRIFVTSSEKFSKPSDNFEIIIPEEEAIFPLLIRNAENTDKYKKINSDVKQKVFEMIRSSGIPSDIRNLLPVIINGNNDLVWVCGSPVSDRYKVRDQQNKFLKIKMESPLFKPYMLFPHQ